MGMKLSKALMKQLGLCAPRKRAKPRPKPKPRPVALVGPPGSWSVVIPGYLPPSLNTLMHCHWRTKHKLKTEADALVAWYGRHVISATTKRRVLLTMVRAGRDRPMDDDNAKKAVLDALVKTGIIGGDDPTWVECPDPVQIAGEARELRIEIEECDG